MVRYRYCELFIIHVVVLIMSRRMTNYNYVDETQNNTLYNLVRGGKSNLLVTNSVGADEYRPKRPQRITVLMTTKPLGGTDYVPKRGESESSSDKGDSSYSESSSGEDEASEEGFSEKEEEPKTLSFQEIPNVTGKEEFEGESDAEEEEKSRCNTSSSYKEALMKTTSKRAKAASPNSLEKSNPNKVPGEPMKIFDSDKISEIDSFDRFDYLRRKSDAKSSKSRNSIGSLTLESP
jgi:hypothetical protein